MSILCCNEERDSCFCPECGKKLKIHGLVTLLVHCRSQARAMGVRIESYKHMAANSENVGNPEKQERYKYHLSRLGKGKAKWDAWVAELQKVIDGE